MAKDLSKIDLVFILDTTSSMYPYINNAKQNMNRIYDEIIKAEKCHLRLGLVNYRDHPPQDSSYITEIHQLTDDVNKAKQFINNTQACGGGDLPEAICCGLNDCLNKIDWLESSVKIAILIADAPPHGIGCSGDGFSKGCPLNNDPVEIAHKLTQKGITLYCVGCEPALTPYKDFFVVLSSVSGGRYLPLNNADNLSNMIIYGTNEEVRMEKLMAQIQNRLLKEAAEKGVRVNEEELTKRVHQLLNENGKGGDALNLTGVVKMNENLKEMSKQKTLKDLLDYARANNVSLTQNGVSSSTTLGRGFTGFTGFSTPTPVKPYLACTRGKTRKPKKAVTFGIKRTRNLKVQPKRQNLIRKSARILKKLKSNLNSAFGSIYASKNRRSERLLMKQLQFQFQLQTKIKKRKISSLKNTNVKAVDSFDDFETIDMDCSRRLAKKVIARNNLNF